MKRFLVRLSVKLARNNLPVCNCGVCKECIDKLAKINEVVTIINLLIKNISNLLNDMEKL